MQSDVRHLRPCPNPRPGIAETNAMRARPAFAFPLTRKHVRRTLDLGQACRSATADGESQIVFRPVFESANCNVPAARSTAAHVNDRIPIAGASEEQQSNRHHGRCRQAIPAFRKPQRRPDALPFRWRQIPAPRMFGILLEPVAGIRGGAASLGAPPNYTTSTRRPARGSPDTACS